jgi:penicillin-binding protein 1C
MRRALRAAAATLGLALLAAAVLWAAARVGPLPERLAQPGSAVVEYRDGSPAHVFLSPDDKWRVPVPAGEIDARYVEALLAFEDARFSAHPGVDPLAVARALWTNLREGRVVSGASTLTMQLVRVLEPRPRTLRSKLIEAFRALQLEARLDKAAVLEAYLTFIPFGGNIEGVEAASLAYFGHSARALSEAEVATLLAVPQRPQARYPSAHNRERLRAARDAVIGRLVEKGVVVAPERQAEVLAEPVPARLRAFPREAAHAAYWLRARDPRALRYRTTLDRGVQRSAASALEVERRDARRRGIHDGAIVVVEHDGGEVRALVGGFDFFEERRGAQLPSFAVARSPGSTLKPLLYAMALDEGRVLPDFLVPDTPVRYGGYAPKNYDESYSGLVTLRDALARSLNVPFVMLLEEVGTERLVGTLRSLGALSLRPEVGHYGLSAIVGGIELSPLELAGVYAALARGGAQVPLRLLDAEPRKEARRMVSPGAAELTRRALAIRDRPDFPERRRVSGAPPSVHWKTGTSFGHRDAWSVGFTERYTSVVWFGNLDNQPSAALVGSEAAGPTLFDVLEGLDGRRPMPAQRPVPGLGSVEVCAYSGRPPTEACPHTRRVDAIVDRVPPSPCPYHRFLDVDLDTGRALTPACRAGRRYERQTFLSLPPEVRRWMRAEQRRLPEPPAWAEGCQLAAAAGPRIVSPPAGQVRLLVPGVPAGRQEVPLEARVAAPGSRLSWFIDGRFLGSVPGEEPLWWTPAAGRHEIVVTDDAGLSDWRTLEVRALH